MKKIICISGELGSGKSAVSKLIAQRLGYEYFSAGMFFRELAEKMGISVLEVNRLSEMDSSIDRMVDSRIIEVGKIKQNIIFDSRMAWHFVNQSFKVYLTIDIKEAARRILKEPRGASEVYNNIDEVINGLKNRREAESKRYMSKYGVDIENLNNYHFIIDTTTKSPDEVADLIINEYLNTYLKKD